MRKTRFKKIYEEIRKKIEACPDCKTKLVFGLNETYCPKCGLVIDDSPIDNDDYNQNGKPSKFIDGDTTKTLPTDIGDERT